MKHGVFRATEFGPTRIEGGWRRYAVPYPNQPPGWVHDGHGSMSFRRAAVDDFEAESPRGDADAEGMGSLGFRGMALVSDGGNRRSRRRVPPGPDASSAHRRPRYSLSGCTPAEPDSASPGGFILARENRFENHC